MRQLTVYDPPQCCSTGVCGPSVDPKLSRLAADLDWLENQGVAVTRYNLSQQPGAFVENATIKGILERRGEEALPVFLVDGLSRQRQPKPLFHRKRRLRSSRPLLVP